MSKVFKNYRTESRIQWGVTIEEGENIKQEQIRTGAMLRIADSMEVISHNYVVLLEERDRYKKWYNQECEKNKKLHRTISALQGVITRLKNRKKNASI